jgi:hypothetical protein
MSMLEARLLTGRCRYCEDVHYEPVGLLPALQFRVRIAGWSSVPVLVVLCLAASSSPLFGGGFKNLGALADGWRES